MKRDIGVTGVGQMLLGHCIKTLKIFNGCGVVPLTLTMDRNHFVLYVPILSIDSYLTILLAPHQHLAKHVCACMAVRR
jgi:hypothetical protein